MKLIVYPDPILTKISEPISKDEFTLELALLCNDMHALMLAENGIGLSAVQIGVLKRIVTMYAPGGCSWNFINPEILETDGEFIFSEGCLSVPGYFEDRQRANKIRLRFENTHGQVQEEEFEGIEAFCIQHELDHLEGKLFIDDLSPLKKNRVRAKIKKTLKRNG